MEITEHFKLFHATKLHADPIFRLTGSELDTVL
jgi:hypothetical protein